MVMAYGDRVTFKKSVKMSRPFGGFPFFPQGWVYQNLIPLCETYQKDADLLGEDGVIIPSREQARSAYFQKVLKTFPPFTVLLQTSAPSFTNAWHATASAQTYLNECAVVCALERYHLAQGKYPEFLEALVPEYIDKIPRDIIGGGALHYSRNAPEHFTLYSIGWNEIDDGGVRIPDKSYVPVHGDWVWPPRNRIW
jgi:hypothetical protein